MYSKDIHISTPSFSYFFSEPTQTHPSFCTEPQDLLVTHYNCEENEQKTLHKYAINQITQCESEPQAIETTKIKATLYSKTRATTLTGYNSVQHFPKKSTLFTSLKQ